MPFRDNPSARQLTPSLIVILVVGLILVVALHSCSQHSALVVDDSLRPMTISPHVASKPWTNAERARLNAMLDADFAPVLGSKQNGFVMLAADGTVLYDRNGSAPRAPASTLKVLTAATAMHILGADYRFKTRLASLDAVNDGVLDGDLYLIGGGDPVLSTADLRAGINGLYAQGLRSVMGHAVIDTTAFVGPEQNPHWASDDLNLDYASGTSALSLNGDIEMFDVVPMSPGTPARILLEPANTEVTLVGSIMTASAGSNGTVHIDHVQGRNEYHLSGSIDSGADQRFPIPVGNVGQQVGGVLDTMLKKHNIAVQTPARIDAAPLGATILWQHQSPPLREIAHHMLVISDNHVAEQLLRTIAAASGHQGTEAEGIRVEAGLLNRLGVPDRGMRLYDGSGLSPGNRIAPRSLAAVIADALESPGSPLIAGLPRVGIEGTVKGHTLHASFGHVRAKSGHITGVDGLAGVIQTPHHGPIAFAFITNDADDGTVEDAEDTIFDSLMQY
jgi:D-alanyl-D-alanine carboxypeptidase/D-alanyl-D-alanine-endopeptidase (penicillin-binding protein 4)